MRARLAALALLAAALAPVLEPGVARAAAATARPGTAVALSGDSPQPAGDGGAAAPEDEGGDPSVEAPGAAADPVGGGGGGLGVLGALWSPVRHALDDWFLGLARSALKPVLSLLGDTVFATPDVTVPGTVRDYWAYSLAIADAVLALLVVMAGVLLMAHETVQTRTTIKEVAPRLLLAAAAANASLGLTGMLVRAANALSAALLRGFDPKSGHAATEALLHSMLGIVVSGGVFGAILGITVAALGLGVLCTYIARVATVVVLVGAAPLFLVFHAVPQLDGAARLWWRNLVGCLGVQVGQALVMSAALRVFFHDDGRSLAHMPGGGTMDLLVVGSLFWLLLKIPAYAGRLIFAPRSASTVVRQAAGTASQAAGAVRQAGA